MTIFANKLRYEMTIFQIWPQAKIRPNSQFKDCLITQVKERSNRKMFHYGTYKISKGFIFAENGLYRKLEF